MDGAPPFFTKLIDNERFCFLKFNKLIFFNIFWEILKDVKETIDIFISDLLEHLFALCVKILPDIKLLFLVRLVLLFSIPVLFLYDLLHLVLLETQNVIEVALIDIDILVLLLDLGLFQQF